jgi:hypothetical protein
MLSARDDSKVQTLDARRSPLPSASGSSVLSVSSLVHVPPRAKSLPL